MTTTLHDNRQPEHLLDEALSELSERTATLAELLDAGQPDLPPAPRGRRGRHRAQRGSIRIETVIVSVWFLSIVSLAVLVLLATTGKVDVQPPADCSKVSCTNVGTVYPTPVPGAPPQAPHAGFPGSETLAP